jgi:hypothetical protein
MTRPAVLVLALALTTGVVDAGGAPRTQPPPKSTAQQAADRHFKSGVARFKEAKYTEALAEFERAYEISPHPLVLYNIAGCYRELSRYGEAVKYYTKFLSEGVGKVPTNRLSDAQNELDSIFALVARVTVTVEPAEGTTVFLDGAPLGPISPDLPLILAPGEHRLVARAPGRADAERTMRVASGDQRVVELTLPSLQPEPVKITPGPPAPPGPKVAVRPGPDTSVRAPGSPPVRPAPKRFAVNAGFGTDARRVREATSGTASVGLGLAIGSRLELGVDATLVAYSVMPSVRVRIAGQALAVHAIAAVPVSFTDGDERDTWVAGAVGLGLRLRVPSMPSLALRLESWASFAAAPYGTTIPTFLGGELWF